MAVLLNQLHVADDSEQIAHLVRKLLQESMRIGEAHDPPVVVPTDLQHTPVGVREPADPLQILVAPRRLPLDVLILVHRVAFVGALSSTTVPDCGTTVIVQQPVGQLPRPTKPMTRIRTFHDLLPKQLSGGISPTRPVTAHPPAGSTR